MNAKYVPVWGGRLVLQARTKGADETKGFRVKYSNRTLPPPQCLLGQMKMDHFEPKQSNFIPDKPTKDKQQLLSTTGRVGVLSNAVKRPLKAFTFYKIDFECTLPRSQQHSSTSH